MSWFIRQRQDFIRAQLQAFGMIRRADIMRKFEVSMPQASADIQQYIADHPDAIDYDRVAKCYVFNDPNAASLPPATDPAIPAGWKLVPVEPTHEMIQAAAGSEAIDDEGIFPALTDLIGYSGENKTRTVIRAALTAALAAAPTIPATGEAVADHGTGEQAIAWGLRNTGAQLDLFLDAWSNGSAESEWPEYYAWLRAEVAGHAATEGEG